MLPTSQTTLYLLITPFQLGLALKKAPKGRPRYFVGNQETLQPKIPAKPSMLLIKPTRTNSNLAKLVFKPEQIALSCSFVEWHKFAYYKIVEQ